MIEDNKDIAHVLKLGLRERGMRRVCPTTAMQTKGDLMNNQITSHRFIKFFAFFLLIFLFLISGNEAFSSQKDEESKAIFFVR